MRSVHGGSLNEEEFLEEGEQPSSKRRGVKRGAARRPSCRGHQEIMISNKTSLGGEAPHNNPRHSQNKESPDAHSIQRHCAHRYGKETS